MNICLGNPKPDSPSSLRNLRENGRLRPGGKQIALVMGNLFLLPRCVRGFRGGLFMKMKYSKWFFAVWVGFVLCPVPDTHSMSAFSRKYRLECGACHAKVPGLNKFGVSFMENNFTIPGRDVPRKKHEEKSLPAGNVDAGGENAEDGSAGADERQPKAVAGEEGRTNEESSPKPAIEEDARVYRRVGKDGVVMFSDIPWPVGVSIEQKGKRRNAGMNKRSEKGSNTLIARGKQIPRAFRLETAPGSKNEPAKRYRGYSECMESKLLQGAIPGDAQLAMGIILEAERQCEQFRSGGD